MKKLLFVIVFVFTSSVLFAQTTVTGKVTDAITGDPLPGASIAIVDQNLGTTSDFDGNYTLTVNQSAPFTLEASSVGFQSMTAEVTSNNQSVNFALDEAAEALDEVVVSASRTPESVRESPVTIERMDARAIQSTSSPSFYDGLENLKGIDINTNSLTFKSVNTRGFATFANARFVQLVDGMDNSSPALNFVIGNLLGMNELDVNSIEILPGASSALYGANAFNGILFMTSKDPFKHTGISTYLKTGLTMQDAAGDNAFYDVGIRAAHKFNDKIAVKANFSFLKGTDWWANDYNQYTQSAVGEANDITPFSASNPGFDALNRYGDEVATTLNYDAILNVPEGTFGSSYVARTGYNEVDLMDYDARSVKADFALHYKPWGDDKEVILNYRTGKGSTIYQGANRYSLDNMVMNQIKLEFKGDNFFVRGYRTTEDAADAYDSRFAAININRDWKSDVDWFTGYATGYLGMFTGAALADPSVAALAGALGLSPGDVNSANTFARMFADNLTPFGPMIPSAPSFPVAGSSEFNTAFNKIISDPNLSTGAKFVDQSSVNHVDANYNLSEMISEWADLQVGGSYRKYSLNSDGTIFTDYDGAIDYDEYGAYMQLSKKFADERLKFTGSARYDKAQNFDGNVSPRLALVYSAGENRNHNFRGSFQTGFRNPTTQDQYIGLDAGRAILVGSAPDNLDRYESRPILISNSEVVTGIPYGTQLGYSLNEETLTGRDAYENSFTLSSLYAFAASGNPADLKQAEVEYVQPERITAYELGYRGKIGGINIDLNGYYNQYDGFIATKTVVAPVYGEIGAADMHAVFAVINGDYKPFQVYTNSAADISSYGATIGLSTKVDKFKVGLNYTYAQFDFDQTTDPDYEAGFNTPEHKIKASLGTQNLFENFGFNINARYNTEYLWESSFVDGIVPSNTVFDAQISYKVPNFKSLFKVGGANIGGDNYMSAPGSGYVGSQYYISWTVNP